MGIQAGLIIHEQPRRSTGIPCSEANGTEPPPWHGLPARV